MTAALVIVGYSLAVAWCLPSRLARLTAPGINARLGLTAWLAAMGVALAGLVIALQCLISAAIAGWPVLAEAICRTATAHSCPPTVYQSAMYEIPIAAAAAGGALMTAVLAWQYGRRLHQSRSRAQAHAEAARVTGRPLSAASGAVVLEAAEPAAYCVPGRPPAIVLSTGALALLDSAQLAAVVAHERAHLDGTHPLLVMVTRGLAAAFPAVPVFTQGTVEVTRLTEMRADDLAARVSGRSVLITALLAMSTGAAVPPLALAATSGCVTERVQRLLEPSSRSRHARNRLALMIVIALMAVTLGIVIWFADPVAAHAAAASRIATML